MFQAVIENIRKAPQQVLGVIRDRESLNGIKTIAFDFAKNLTDPSTYESERMVRGAVTLLLGDREVAPEARDEIIRYFLEEGESKVSSLLKKARYLNTVLIHSTPKSIEMAKNFQSTVCQKLVEDALQRLAERGETPSKIVDVTDNTTDV